ncbi:MAG: hypothetical protein JSU96_11250 [Acidobacteriota bacterium]|nr:MAG: hypothetical protein JSU96_11250 [Acidobacteriota bacterium]
MSRNMHYQIVRNHFSILLSQMRARLTPSLYRTSLKRQLAFDVWVEDRSVGPRIEGCWLREVAGSLAECFRGLRSGKTVTREFQRLCHLYLHLGNLGIRTPNRASISARKPSDR